MANYFNTLNLRQQLAQLGKCRFMGRDEFADGASSLQGKKVVIVGCGVALLPEVVLENSPEPVRNRVMILERSDEKTPFELGVCAQKKRLHEPLIEAFWKILPNHK